MRNATNARLRPKRRSGPLPGATFAKRLSLKKARLQPVFVLFCAPPERAP